MGTGGGPEGVNRGPTGGPEGVQRGSTGGQERVSRGFKVSVRRSEPREPRNRDDNVKNTRGIFKVCRTSDE
eukprot:3810191-Pyramimonas_sp.AAC.1